MCFYSMDFFQFEREQKIGGGFGWSDARLNFHRRAINRAYGHCEDDKQDHQFDGEPGWSGDSDDVGDQKTEGSDQDKSARGAMVSNWLESPSWLSLGELWKATRRARQAISSMGTVRGARSYFMMRGFSRATPTKAIGTQVVRGRFHSRTRRANKQEAAPSMPATARYRMVVAREEAVRAATGLGQNAAGPNPNRAPSQT